MTTAPVDLTLEIRCEDGSSAEFYQDNEERIGKTLRMLVTPRLFAQPLLVLASPQGISLIPCRTIDMILAYTAASAPLLWPAGVLDITQVPAGVSAGDPGRQNSAGSGSSESADTATSHIQIHTVGAWDVTVGVKGVEQATVLDERQLMFHFLDLPVVPFRMAAGGIGFINPAKISRVTALPPAKTGRESAWPALNAVPDNSLPAELVRWTSLLQRIHTNSERIYDSRRNK